MISRGDDKEMTNPITPVFLAYRCIDGEKYARLVYEELNGVNFDGFSLEIFCDLFTPASDDFTKYNIPALMRAKSLVLIVTPGAMAPASENDWLFKEIDWWIANRPGVAPIVLNSVPAAGDRFFPAPIKNLWPNLNWLPIYLEKNPNNKVDVFLRLVNSVNSELPQWAESELDRQQKLLISERRQRQKLRLYLIVSLIALLVVAVLGSITFVQQTKLKDAEYRERTAKEEALEMLDVAQEGLARGLVEEGQRILESDPAKALRLAELASSLTTSIDPGSLFRSAMVEHPVWSRIGPLGMDGSDRAMFPKAPNQSDIFALNKDMSTLVLAAKPSSIKRSVSSWLLSALDDYVPAAEIVAKPPMYDWDRMFRIELELRAVPSGRSIDKITLRDKEWFVAPEPSATELFVTRIDGENKDDGWNARIYKLSHNGFSDPLLDLTEVHDIAFSDGTWPCFVLFSDGTLKQYISPTNQRILGKWPSLRVSAHPKGSAVVLSKSDGFIWIGLNESTPTVANMPWQPMTQKGVEMATAIKWGPKSHHVLVYRLKGELFRGKPSLATSLIAYNMESKSSRELSTEPIEANAFTRLVFEVGGDGSRIVTTTFESSTTAGKFIEKPGGLPLVLTLKWLADDDEQVVDSRRLPDSVLRGDQKSATKVSFRSAAVSPNGKYVVVGSDMRTTSGTGAGTGVVDSWDLSPLDYEGSSTTEARRLHFGDSTVQRIAYSSDGSRVAVWDHEGTTHFFRVAIQSHGPFDTHRLPVADVKRLAPSVRTIDFQGRYWFVDFGGGDRQILDLWENGSNGIGKALEGVPLDTFSIDEIGVVVVTESEIRMLKGKMEEKKALEEPGISASVGPQVTAVLGSESLTLYNSSTLDVLSVINIGKLDSEFRTSLPDLVDAHFENRSKRSIHRWYRTENGFDILHDIGDGQVALCRLSGEGNGLFQVDCSELMNLDTKREWHSIRRSSDGNHVVVLSGDNDPDTTADLQYFSLDSDQEVYDLEPPTSGWPAQLMEVLDVKEVVPGELVVLFRYVNLGETNIETLEEVSPFFQGFSIGIFRESGGPSKWHDFGNPKYRSPDFIAADWEEPVEKTLILAKNSDKVLLLQLPGGKEVFSEQIATDLLGVPPPLRRIHDSSWEIYDRSIYHKTIQFLLMGGGRLSEVTSIRMPLEREQEVAKLVAHRQRLRQEVD